MEQLINIIVSVMLVTMCISGILTIAVFWYLVLSGLFAYSITSFNRPLTGQNPVVAICSYSPFSEESAL